MKTFDGKLKAVTFSFDDGVTQDKRLIEILNAYGLKATFNLNSAYLGTEGELDRNGHIVRHDKNPADSVAKIYAGHEVAAHTLNHPNLTYVQDDDEVVRQVEQDRKALSALTGYEVRCLAYPCGGTNCDDRVASLVRNNTGIRFARTVTSSYSFDIPTDLIRYNPTVYYIEKEKMFELGKKFIELQTDKPQVFYVWGHSYEMDAEYLSWKDFEKFCKMISGKKDVFYGTNSEVFLK